MDDQAQSLLDVAGSVLGELDLEVVVDRVLQSARELTGARYAALGVLDDSRTELERFITVGIDEDARAADRCAAAWPWRAWGADPRSGAVASLRCRRAPPLVRVSARASADALVPRGSDSRCGVPFGSLYLTEKADGSQFTDEDEKSATTLARFAGVAIDHARRYTGAAARGDELARTVAALQATTEIARAVGGATDVEVILELVAKRGRALVSARALLDRARRRQRARRRRGGRGAARRADRGADRAG